MVCADTVGSALSSLLVRERRRSAIRPAGVNTGQSTGMNFPTLLPTHLPAGAAGVGSRFMEKETGNTAHRNAISQIDLAMNEWMQREARYLITMIIIRSWQKSDLVTDEEFDLIDAMMIEEYRPKIKSFLID